MTPTTWDEEYDLYMQPPDPEPPIYERETWFVGQETDGEYTGPGDSPSGYVGEPYDIPDIFDAETGALIAECVDVETAKRIVAMHEVCYAVLKWQESAEEAYERGESDPLYNATMMQASLMLIKATRLSEEATGRKQA